MESIQCYGIWVPKSDARVFARYPEFEGLPDLDVGKVAKCAALSSSFGTALDIGAHVGAVTVYLSRKFSRVVAFEAIPSTFEYLQRNTEALDNVECLNVAVGPAQGETYFSHYAKHGQLSHVAGESEIDRTSRVGPVPVRTIDSFEFSDLSFIKIDVEGFELQVLEGARETIERCRPLVLVEQAGNEEKHYGRPKFEASALLESLGMRLHPDAPQMKNDRLYTFPGLEVFDALAANRNTLAARCESYAVENAALMARVAALEATAEDLKVTKAALQEQRRSTTLLNAQVQELNDRTLALEHELAASRSRRKEMARVIANREARLKARDEELEKLQQIIQSSPMWQMKKAFGRLKRRVRSLATPAD